MNKTILAAVAPSFGPSVMIFFGVQIPIAAFSLSLVGLLLARHIARPPRRTFTRSQNFALTAILALILLLAVAGEIRWISPEPLGVGMAVVWGVGLGWSGIIVIEIIGKKIVEGLKVVFGIVPETPDEL